MCGGTPRRDVLRRHREGPSPHVRGHHRARGRPVAGRGSIPACAGAPCHDCVLGAPIEVHPRMCGGTREHASHPWRRRGPSPHVRGHQMAGGGGAAGRGSIPACAGAPGGRRLSRTERGVHPRMCGGTSIAPTTKCRPGGPSPHVRGHLAGAPPEREWQRSIPACAGAPKAKQPAWQRTRVHPRMCGGTIDVMLVQRLWWGPSPHVRGHPHLIVDGPFVLGSIPACAGAP